MSTLSIEGSEARKPGFSRLRVLRSFRPLAFVDESTLLGSRGFKLFTYSIPNNHFEFVTTTGSLQKKMLSKSRMVTRLLRLGFRHGIEVEERQFFLRLGRDILRLDLQRKKLTKEAVADQFHPPLSFGKISGVGGFDNQVVFGEYFHNPSQKKTVSLYSWKPKTGWSKPFEFPTNTINHVHTIVPDQQRSGAWILTGDFDDAAAIWFATNNFETVECVAKGSQEVRACFGFPTEEGLYFCTDSPLEKNYFSLLSFAKTSNQWTAEKRNLLSGPVIFHGSCKSGRLFSTSVEPMPTNAKTSLFSKITWNRGPGVLSNHSSVWHLAHDGELTEISQNKKDLLPYLFQFGMSTFPANGDRSDYLVYFNIALKNNDYSTEIWQPTCSPANS